MAQLIRKNSLFSLFFIGLNFLHAEVINDSTKEDNKSVSIAYFFYKNAYCRGNLPYLTAKNSQRTYYAYNTADSRIFKGDSQQGLYYMSGTGVLDLATNQWEYHPTAHTQIKNGTPYFLSLDHLGNTRAVVANNIIEAQYDYYPYGKPLRKWENVSSRYLSTGHEQDAETGYNARNARWQDAEALGFGQIDPLSDAFPSQSPYSYSNNNPIMYNDPTGMYSDEFTAKNQREVALRMGKDVGEVYQSGKHFLFNGDKSTFKDKDFITEEFEKNKSWYQGFEEGVNDLYNSSPDWVRNFAKEDGVGTKSIQLMADMVMGMHPGVNGYSLYTGQDWRGQNENRLWAAVGLVSLGSTKAVTQSHHLIPNQIFREFSEQLGKMGWSQNHVKNLMKIPVPFHGNHPAYSEYVRREIALIVREGGSIDDVIALQNRLRSTINGALQNGATNLNNYFKELIKP